MPVMDPGGANILRIRYIGNCLSLYPADDW
jgi:hypothetical protein